MVLAAWCVMLGRILRLHWGSVQRKIIAKISYYVQHDLRGKEYICHEFATFFYIRIFPNLETKGCNIIKKFSPLYEQIIIKEYYFLKYFWCLSKLNLKFTGCLTKFKTSTSLARKLSNLFPFIVLQFFSNLD